MNIGQKVRELRIAKNLTQEELAEMINDGQKASNAEAVSVSDSSVSTDNTSDEFTSDETAAAKDSEEVEITVENTDEETADTENILTDDGAESTSSAVQGVQNPSAAETATGADDGMIILPQMPDEEVSLAFED